MAFPPLWPGSMTTTASDGTMNVGRVVARAVVSAVVGGENPEVESAVEAVAESATEAVAEPGVLVPGDSAVVARGGSTVIGAPDAGGDTGAAGPAPVAAVAASDRGAAEPEGGVTPGDADPPTLQLADDAAAAARRRAARAARMFTEVTLPGSRHARSACGAARRGAASTLGHVRLAGRPSLSRVCGGRPRRRGGRTGRAVEGSKPWSQVGSTSVR